MPLVEGVQKGDRSTKDDLVSIRLIGPSEIPGDFSDDNSGLFLRTSGKYGVSVDVAFYGDRHTSVEKLSDKLKRALAEGAELDEDEELFSEFGDEEDEFNEEMQKKMPQLMVHIMCQAVQSGVREMLTATHRRALDETIYEAQGKRALKVFAGAVLLNVGFGPGVVTELMAGGLIGANMYLTQRNLNTYAKFSPVKEGLIAANAQEKAQEVYDDLHRTYCVTHFDQTVAELFPEWEEPEGYEDYED